MRGVFQTIGIFLLITVAGCETVEPLPETPGALVGTRAKIKMHGQDVVAEVTEVTGRIVKTEFKDWRGSSIREVDLYRGLFPIGGIDQGLRYESQFDQNDLEPLFPLKVGKSVGVGGTINYIDGGESAEFWAHIEVVGEKNVELKRGPQLTFIVEIEWEFKWNGLMRRKTDTVYFDPEHSMILKSVIRGNNFQNYWVVVAVEEPESTRVAPASPTQRRSGTVMI